jgi:multiple sugar transport system substrate-binding protein
MATPAICRIRTAPSGAPVAPVGGYALGIPANLAPERVEAAVEALIAFTSAQAQKLYVQNGSRTAPRYSVGADPEVRRLSTIFEAVDQMSWRDELQFWPRPPVPQICGIIDLRRGIPRHAARGRDPARGLDRPGRAEEITQKPG